MADITGSIGTIDTVSSSTSYVLPDSIENLTLTGTGNINGTGNALDNVMTGNTGNNVLSGLDGNDTLIGGAGTDTLDGGAGADNMQGGTGDDTYVVDNAGDSVTEAANAGTDTVQSSISYTLTDNVENLTLTGTDDLNGTGNTLNNLITGNSGNNVLDGGTGNDTINAGAGNDIVIGGDGNDLLNGEAGDDQLLGNAGNDTLNGGLGADNMQGGTGDDTYVVDDIGDIVTEAANEGTDTVQSSITYTLTDNVENLTLTGTADINGTGNGLNNLINGNAGSNVLDGLEGNDTLNGNAGNDVLMGGDGDDLLNGGTGADNMQGGTGNDTYVVDDIGDIVTEAANAGTDTVQSSISYTLTDNVENLTLTGSAIINGTGNVLDNVMTGNSGNNVLSGLDGNDTLIGGAGNDTLNGGAGADNMQGGTGDDTYVVDDIGDSVTEALNAGTDTVQSSISYTLTDNVENLTLTGTDDLNGTGNTLNNLITGNSGNNVLDGGTGNDTINAGAGNDIVIGGDGNDLLNGEAGDDQLLGNAGNDTLNGGLGADNMQGGTGDDTYVVDDIGDIVTEAANEGTDTVQSSITYTLTDNVENLTLTGTADINGTGNGLNNLINGNAGSNVLDGLEGNDTLNGNAGNDVLMGGDGDDLLNGGTGADNMQGGTGNDTYVVDDIGDIVTEAANAGTDTVQSSISYTLTDNVENLTLTGSAIINGTGNVLDNVMTGNSGNNVLSGLDGNDTLIGGAGNDTLNGGAGADNMQGGTGDDTYVVDDIGDIVTEALNAGADTVQSSITYTLTGNVENLTLTGTDDLNGTGNTLNNLITGNSGNNVLDGGAGNDTINAGAGNDIVTGGDGNDLLNGEAGDDQLLGNAGNDTLNGGLGADNMQGGTGDDTYVVDDIGDIVTEAANEGTDTVQSSITYTLTDNVENLTLTGTADINGTGNGLNNLINGNAGSNVLDGLEGNDTLNGNAGNDVLMGGDGDDLLNGGTGADNMQGGTGNDTYVVDDIGDIVTEAANAGTDTVQSSISYTLTDNVENLTLTGSAIINGTGNVLDNVMTGNSGNNVLSGLDGNDTLIGGAGNDTLNGGAGADNMQGGTGDDTYVVDNAGDTVTEAANAGTDTVQSGISYTLTGNVENLTLTGTDDLNGTGNTLNNLITGNSGNNVLDGGVGVDTMSGGSGNDTYSVDNTSDVITEAANGGNDIAYASANYTLSANVENLVLTGTAAINGTGNAQDNVITGNDGSNVLNGMAGNDLLLGGGGNDTIDGGLDADTMQGGTGNDTYVVDNAGDLVAENMNEGIDTVQSSISYTLTDNVENLTLTGSAIINGTGNVLDNVMTGNSGNNVLSGLDGNDTLIGGAGNDTLNGGAGADNMQGGTGDDTYVVDDIGDSVTEALNAGTDTVQSSISYTLTGNVENLALTGTDDLNGTGNTLNNLITGNSGNNVLDGGAGADTMSGGSGNDTYSVDNTSDVVVEGLDGGVDTVRASANTALSANVENLVLLGTANINGTGNSSDNLLVGNDGMNVLDGGAGADTINAGAGNDIAIGGDGNDLLNGEAGDDQLYGDAGNDMLNGGLGADMMQGGAGDDTYTVDNVADVIVEASGGGTDNVYASVDTTLSDNVENLFLTGTSDIGGTGNASDNILTGNSGNNTLAGMDGNDILDGGRGNDLLLGGAGDDSYLFRLGDGNDRIVDTQGDNTLHIGSGLTQADLHLERDGNDIVITIPGTTDSIVLADWLNHSEGVNHIVFDNGTQLDRQGIGLLLNAPPVAVADSITVHEDGGIANIPVTQLLANDTDPNPGDVLTVTSLGGSGVGASVSLVDGMFQYDIGNRFQQLAEGEVLKDSVAYTISDAQGASSTSVVEVSIIGTNDAPVVTADTAHVTEDALTTVSGNVLANDSDVDNGTVLRAASAGTLVGTYGSLTLATDGSYTYSLNNEAANVQSLSEGQTVVDRFSYLASDGIADVASSLEMTVTGTNDAPVVTADTASVTEDTLISASGNVLANDSDADAGAMLRVASAGTFVGTYGSLTLAADGSYTYSLNNAAIEVQSLDQGQVVIDRFTYAATDGIAEVSSALDIAITGTRDAPVVLADTAQVTEDMAISASGNVLANDSSTDAGMQLKVASPGTLAGAYGNLTLGQDGSYLYRLNNTAASVQALGRETSVLDRFTYTVSDGMTDITSGLEVTVHGANDAPILVAPLADQDFTFNKPFSWKMPAGSFADMDAGDTLTYTATLADGSALPDWLTFDAANQTLSGITPKKVGSVDIRITATDKVAADGSTAGSLSTSDVFRLSVSHGNQGVGNGQDAAPAGQCTNFNDGPGTAPGNPGAKGGRANVGIAPLQIPVDDGKVKACQAAVPEQEAQTLDKKADKQAIPACLSSHQLEQYASSSTSSIGNVASAQAFSHWLTVDLAVSAVLADQKSLSWLDDRVGADTSGLSKATVGYLGSTAAFSGDALSLAAGTAKEMKTFQGLGKGLAKIA